MPSSPKKRGSRREPWTRAGSAALQSTELVAPFAIDERQLAMPQSCEAGRKQATLGVRGRPSNQDDRGGLLGAGGSDDARALACLHTWADTDAASRMGMERDALECRRKRLPVDRRRSAERHEWIPYQRAGQFRRRRAPGAQYKRRVENPRRRPRDQCARRHGQSRSRGPNRHRNPASIA